jgi:mannose-6-phosphate isomerase
VTQRLVFPLDNALKHYAWGSHTVLAGLRGESAPSHDAEAELWMGAHRSAPSSIEFGGVRRSLAEVLEEAPQAMLGPAAAGEFGSTLPFLLKLLAAAEPLSLQAHPNLEQARAGFARENLAGIPLDARERSYRDQNHKPELIAALTPFHALVGFRTLHATQRLLSGLNRLELAPFISALGSGPEPAALRSFFELVTRIQGERARLVAEATLGACRERAAEGGEFAREYAWGARIGELYPGDPSLVLALALNLVVLEPGQALHLPAGNLHAYLEGAGVEIMASSDNVLRGGLTPKHVAVAELLAVLDFRAGPAAVVETTEHGAETRYITPVREFALSRFDLDGRTDVRFVAGPEIVVVTRGRIDLRRGNDAVSLKGAESAFVPAEGGDYVLAGTGTAFRARVNVSI